MKRHSIERTSVLLGRIIEQCKEKPGTISIGAFLSLLGDRALYLAILVFSLPNSLPVPGIPGFSTITGIPILLIAWQMILGRKELKIPRWIARKEFSQATLAYVLQKGMSAVIWLERLLRPRFTVLDSVWTERACGVLIFILALVISLPIPGGNFLPGVSMTLVALALLERDYLFLIIASLISVASLTVMVEFIRFVLTKIFQWLVSLF